MKPLLNFKILLPISVVFGLHIFAGASTCEKAFSAEFSAHSFKLSVVRNNQKKPSHSPRFLDPIEERTKQREWNNQPKNVPKAFERALPEGVHFIDHQLTRPESTHSLKLNIRGSLMARAHYTYQGKKHSTNVLFSSRALLSNIYAKKEDRWLVSPSAQAVILFLHGMGMQTAGAHIAKNIIQQFKPFKKVEVLSLDLPFHGEGPRTFLSRLKEEVMALSTFAKKYIPPNIPLFVMAHSGGTVFAQKLMSMTDGPKGPAFFHLNLKGVMLFSPIADPLFATTPVNQNQQAEKRQQAFSEGQKKGLREVKTLQENSPLLSPQYFENQNPVGELFGMLNIAQWEAIIPDHGGSKYVPTLMAVGLYDPLIFTGFPQHVFHGYYDSLSNMETHYLEELPHLKTHRMEKVQHFLTEYQDPESEKALLVALSQPFMEKQLGTDLDTKTRPPPPPPVQVMELFAGDLAFRTFLSQYLDQAPTIVRVTPELQQKVAEERKALQDTLQLIFIKHAVRNKLRTQVSQSVFRVDNKEQALEGINQVEGLAEEVVTSIKKALTKSFYFDLKNLMEGVWVPTKKDLLEEHFVHSADTSQVLDLLKEIAHKVRTQRALKEEIKSLKHKISLLKDAIYTPPSPAPPQALKSYQGKMRGVKPKKPQKQKSLQEEFESALLVLNSAIKTAENPAPFSLKAYFEDLKLKRDKALKATAHLSEVFESIAPKLLLTGVEERSLENQLFVQRQDIAQAKRTYQDYSQARETLVRQVLQAILNGEVGDKYLSPVYQKAGQDLYGSGWNAHQGEPQGATYLRLKSQNQVLAETESSFIQKTFLLEQGLKEYHALLSKLYAYLTALEEKKPDLSQRDFVSENPNNILTLAIKAYLFYNVRDILQSEDLALNKEHYYVFQRILDIYQKQFHSDIMPALPGVSLANGTE